MTSVKLPDTTPGEMPSASAAVNPADTGKVESPSSAVRPTFSCELAELAARFDEQPARLADLLPATRGGGYNLTVEVLAAAQILRGRNARTLGIQRQHLISQSSAHGIHLEWRDH